jgi:hypothetical protein
MDGREMGEGIAAAFRLIGCLGLIAGFLFGGDIGLLVH